jgi:hypothetical protein
MIVLGPALVVAIILLAIARGKVAATTLAAVWTWAAVAVAVVGGVEIGVALPGIGGSSSDWSHAARYAAAVLALCPTVAMLGAKRPQDRAWQWVVASFLTVMMLPAARAYLLPGGDGVTLHAVPGTFLLVVVAMGVANWVATRFALAAVLGGAAQMLLVAPYTPLAPLFSDVPFAPPDAAMVGIAAALLSCQLPKRTKEDADASERLWLDFRDQYGLFWAARVMARMNAAARAHRWPASIHWRRVEVDAAIDEHARSAFTRSLRMLLRRFVSTSWLSARDAEA